MVRNFLADYVITRVAGDRGSYQILTADIVAMRHMADLDTLLEAMQERAKRHGLHYTFTLEHYDMDKDIYRLSWRQVSLEERIQNALRAGFAQATNDKVIDFDQQLQYMSKNVLKELEG